MDYGIAGIDHLIVGVRDLEQARLGWSRLGFTLSPRGRHIGQGTANYCIMFANDYVELLGIVDPNDFVQRLDMFLAQREGLMAAAFAPAGAPEDVRAALLGRELHPSEPRLLGRYMAFSSSTWQIGWLIGPAAGGFVLQHEPLALWPGGADAASRMVASSERRARFEGHPRAGREHGCVAGAL